MHLARALLQQGARNMLVKCTRLALALLQDARPLHAPRMHLATCQ